MISHIYRATLDFLQKTYGPKPGQSALMQRLCKEELSLHRQLIQHRESSHLTREDIALRLGTTATAVQEFESLHSNPALSEIRHYALAIGCFVTYDVHFKEEM